MPCLMPMFNSKSPKILQHDKEKPLVSRFNHVATRTINGEIVKDELT
jgi:hypothetical protein